MSLRRDVTLLDVGAALGAFVLFSVPVLAGFPAGHGPLAALVAFGVLTAAPLAFGRVAPVPVLATVTLVLVVASLLDVRFTPFVSNAGPALGVAVLTVADRLPRRTSILLSVVAVVSVTTADGLAYALHPATGHDAVQPFIALAGWLVGYALGTRRRLDARIRTEEASRAQEAERRIRAEERLRVSADVHDIVSHTLGMIAVRAGVARVVLDQRPHEAREALGAIETASRSALDELRAVLHSLRDDAPTPAAPSLADLPNLVGTLRADGFDVTLRCSDDAAAPALVEESAYRIVQEALTNVVRHAGRVTTLVDITRSDTDLAVSIVNEAGAVTSDSSGSGFGLTGMRARVALHDGTIDVGPRPDGGFAVLARIPTP